MEPKYYSRKEFLKNTALGLISVPFLITSCQSSNMAAVTATEVDCELIPKQIEGPYYIDNRLIRTDIREDKIGVPLSLKLQIVDAAGCQPISGALVDIWHCDAQGYYSGYPDMDPSVVFKPTSRNMHVEPTAPEETFLRGVQKTDDRGQVNFQTIYPSWYAGRAIHIHCQVFVEEKSMATTQLYFPQALNEQIHADNDPYQKRAPVPLSNEQDRLYNMAQRSGSGLVTLKTVTEDDQVQASLIISIKTSG